MYYSLSFAITQLPSNLSNSSYDIPNVAWNDVFLLDLFFPFLKNAFSSLEIESTNKWSKLRCSVSDSIFAELFWIGCSLLIDFTRSYCWSGRVSSLTFPWLSEIGNLWSSECDSPLHTPYCGRRRLLLIWSFEFEFSNFGFWCDYWYYWIDVHFALHYY